MAKPWQKILHFFLTKILIGALLVVGVYIAAQYFLNSLLSKTSFSAEIQNLLSAILSASIAVIFYWLLYKFYERRKITELSTQNLSGNLLSGILIGTALQTFTILFMYLKGGYTVTAVNNFWFLVPALSMAFSSAVFEEILLRGIVFRLMEKKLGSYLALIISALIFGALHLANPNSSFFLALGLAIQAGLLLGLAFMFSRNLWFPIAIHFAWNFTQSGIFGASVSGHSTHKSLFSSKISGAEWYSGGAFGPEGSMQATVLCLFASIILLILCIRQNKIIKASWTRS